MCDKCLMFSARVVIPPSLQSTVLETLHQGHPGVVRSKLLPREFVWWPSLAEDISSMASNCSVRALVNFKPDKVFIPWPKSTYPFERVHIDFYEKRSLSYFILCDSYSKWLHVSYMPNTRAQTVISELMSIFAQFGLPNCLVSDNGPPLILLNMPNFVLNIILRFCIPHLTVLSPTVKLKKLLTSPKKE